MYIYFTNNYIIEQGKEVNHRFDLFLEHNEIPKIQVPIAPVLLMALALILMLSLALGRALALVLGRYH